MTQMAEGLGWLKDSDGWCGSPGLARPSEIRADNPGLKSGREIRAENPVGKTTLPRGSRAGGRAAVALRKPSTPPHRTAAAATAARTVMGQRPWRWGMSGHVEWTVNHSDCACIRPAGRCPWPAPCADRAEGKCRRTLHPLPAIWPLELPAAPADCAANQVRAN
jgi:hypothetical protein